MVAPSDLLTAGSDGRSAARTARRIMRAGPIVTHPDEILRAAADQMAEHCVGALPVVTRDTKQLLGILTESDLLKARQRQLTEERHRERVLRLRRLNSPSAARPAVRRASPQEHRAARVIPAWQTAIGLRETGPYRARPRDAGPSRESAGAGPGAVTILLGTGIDDLDPFVGRLLPRAVLAMIAPALLLAWITRMDLLSAAIAALILLLSPVMAALAGTGTALAVRRRLASLERLGDRFTALIEGLPTLRAYGRARDHERAVAASGEEVRAASLATIRLALLAGLVLELLTAVGTALVAVPLGLRLDVGHRILPQALSVLILTPELFLPPRRLIADFHAAASGQAALARLSELTGEPGRHPGLEATPATAAPAGERGTVAAGSPAEMGWVP